MKQQRQLPASSKFLHGQQGPATQPSLFPASTGQAQPPFKFLLLLKRLIAETRHEFRAAGGFRKRTLRSDNLPSGWCPSSCPAPGASASFQRAHTSLLPPDQTKLSYTDAVPRTRPAAVLETFLGEKYYGGFKYKNSRKMPFFFFKMYFAILQENEPVSKSQPTASFKVTMYFNRMEIAFICINT